LLLFPCAGYLPGSPTAFDCEDLAARPPVFRDLMSIGTETIDSIEAQEACVSDCFYGSPGRNRNQIEKTGNLCDFRFWFGTDTPKNTPTKKVAAAGRFRMTVLVSPEEIGSGNTFDFQRLLRQVTRRRQWL